MPYTRCLEFSRGEKKTIFAKFSNRHAKVLLGLDEEYNPVVVVIQSKPEISWLDMQFELLSFEKRLEHQNISKVTTTFAHNASTNVAYNHNNSSYKAPGQRNTQEGKKQQFNGSRGNNNSGGNIGRGRSRGNRPTCQVYSKYGHTANVCY
ncbi:uncharacterized protein LOC120082085 [Benincasa hispida]|uniref:uncharacterized protein LOC120082085 n=1 Tax=Benincasa hispida TaxID=102211 RepID=UPI001900CB28|nr:uncharacterized protein LOC120082085 [Benincasa hispida]